MALKHIFLHMQRIYQELYPKGQAPYLNGFEHVLSDSAGTARDRIGAAPRAIWCKPKVGAVQFKQGQLLNKTLYADQLLTATYNFSIELWLPNDGMDEGTVTYENVAWEEQGLIQEYINNLKVVYPGNGLQIVSGGYSPVSLTDNGELFSLAVKMDFAILTKRLAADSISGVDLTTEVEE